MLHEEKDWNKEDSKVEVAVYIERSEHWSPKPWHFNVLLAKEESAPAAFDLVLDPDAGSCDNLVFEIFNKLNDLLPIIAKRTTAVRAKLCDRHFRTHGPLVSVLIATYNRKEPLERALKSILSQSYKNLEVCLVRDGGEPVGDLVRSINDSRIKLISLEQNGGKAAALNVAFEASAGEYLAYLDDDDIWYEDHLERLMITARLQNQDFVYSNGVEVLMDPDKNEISRSVCYSKQVGLQDLLEFNYITGINVLHKRSLAAKVGGFDSRLRVLIDFDMWRRLACFARPYHVNYTTAEYYLHQEKGRHITDLATKDPLEYRRQRLRVLSKNIPLVDDRLKAELREVKQRAQFEYAVFNCNIALESNDLNQASRSLQQAQKLYTELNSAQLMYAVCLLRLSKPMDALKVFKDCIDGSSDIAYLLMAFSVSLMLKDAFSKDVMNMLASRKKTMTETQLKIYNEYKQQVCKFE